MDDGTRLAYSVHGDESAAAANKRPLMLIHGWACGGADWGAWPKLLSHARPVLTFDQRGTGAGAHDAAAAAAAAVAAAGGAAADAARRRSARACSRPTRPRSRARRSAAPAAPPRPRRTCSASRSAGWSRRRSRSPSRRSCAA